MDRGREIHDQQHLRMQIYWYTKARTITSREMKTIWFMLILNNEANKTISHPSRVMVVFAIQIHGFHCAATISTCTFLFVVDWIGLFLFVLFQWFIILIVSAVNNNAQIPVSLNRYKVILRKAQPVPQCHESGVNQHVLWYTGNRTINNPIT